TDWRVGELFLLHYSITPLLPYSNPVLGFLKQTDVGDSHLFVHRFAHVVDREQGNGDASKRFHFDTGLRDGARGTSDFGAVARNVDVNLDFAQRNGVTKRNEMRGFLGGLNCSDSRGRDDIALGDFVLAD